MTLLDRLNDPATRKEALGGLLSTAEPNSHIMILATFLDAAWTHEKSHRVIVRELVAENDRLRAALAMSDRPCVYCSLSAEDMAKCPSGFPGCARADDAMGCPELGARMRLEELETAQRWQPIETAPKGKHVLIWIPFRYSPIDPKSEDGASYISILAADDDSVWTWREQVDTWKRISVFPPTHWKPLPAPPGSAIPDTPA